MNVYLWIINKHVLVCKTSRNSFCDYKQNSLKEKQEFLIFKNIPWFL